MLDVPGLPSATSNHLLTAARLIARGKAMKNISRLRYHPPIKKGIEIGGEEQPVEHI